MTANILVAFYSRGGVTESLAQAIAEGARTNGADVRLRRAREIVGPEIMAEVPGWKEGAERMNALYEAPTVDDAAWADGIIFGTPTRFGLVSSELKAYIDGLGGLWVAGKLDRKAGSVFTSTSSLHGGNETTLTSMFHPMAHLGMVIVPLGYSDPSMMNGGTPYGASSVSGSNSTPPTEADLAVGRYQGRRVTAIARALKAERDM